MTQNSTTAAQLAGFNLKIDRLNKIIEDFEALSTLCGDEGLPTDIYDAYNATISARETLAYQRARVGYPVSSSAPRDDSFLLD